MFIEKLKPAGRVCSEKQMVVRYSNNQVRYCGRYPLYLFIFFILVIFVSYIIHINEL